MRSRCLALAWMGLLLCLVPRAFSQPTLVQILGNGPTAKRINIVFLAEGYTAAQAGQFADDAMRVLDSMLNTRPLQEYPGYFNAFTIFVTSAESGSDHPSQNIFRDTYFSSSYESYNISQLVTIPPNNFDGVYANGRGKVDALLQELLPDYDISVLIVNDGTYGGSGGKPLVTSVHSSSTEIAVHELGHSFAGLGDEYSTPYPGYPDVEEPNTTKETNRSLIKWRSWILNSTPVPTPDTTPFQRVVGLFEGAHYYSTNWYRPKTFCKMRVLGVPYCEVCSEALIKSIYQLVRPIESVSPAVEPVISLLDQQAAHLEVVPMVPAGHELLIRWFTNGVPVAGAITAAFTIAGSALPTGTNQVKVEVVDATTAVRNDPTALLKESTTWTITVLRSPSLSIVRNAGKVVLSWPATASGYVLQSTENLQAPIAWTLENSSPTLVGNQFTVTNTVNKPRLFFRLRKP